jgi:hypothetical protein
MLWRVLLGRLKGLLGCSWKKGSCSGDKTVEFDLDEVLEYLKESGVGNWGISGSGWKTLEELEEYCGIVITRRGRL